MAEYIKTEADNVDYLNIELEEGDGSEIAHTLSVIANLSTLLHVIR